MDELVEALATERTAMNDRIRVYGLVILGVFLLVLGCGVAGASANGHDVPKEIWNLLFVIVGAIAGLLPPNPHRNGP